MLMILLSGCAREPDISTLGMSEATFRESEAKNPKGVRPDSGAEGNPADTDAAENTGDLTETETDTEEIAVFICGAVNNPGVYYLDTNARVYEAVEAAGGFQKDADTEWLNQAGYLADGQKLQIFTRKETSQMVLTDAQAGPNAGLVNLNTADRDSLMTLPGIGASKADAILDYRREQGEFQTIEDIMQISGIKEAVFSKIKDQITV